MSANDWQMIFGVVAVTLGSFTIGFLAGRFAEASLRNRPSSNRN